MLLENLLHLLGGWAPVFRQHRTHARAVALALGLLCGLGRRTITRAICFNNRQHQDWGADYKLFNRSRWDTRALFEPVIQGAIAQYCPKHIVIGFDETGIKRSGKKASKEQKAAYRQAKKSQVTLATWRWPPSSAALCLGAHTYRKRKAGRRYYRQKAYLLCDDNNLAAKDLLQAYFDR